MKDFIDIIPLGGMGNVTKNMYLYQYDGQILIVDCGIGFPDPTMLGVDVLIPDVSYLKETKDKIVGMVLTHGHDDHIGGLPYVLPQIGTDFPIYGSALTLGFSQDRLREYAIEAQFRELPDKSIQLGNFTIEGIRMTHSVPDARHLVITTPAGSIYHGSDFKFDLKPIDGIRPDFQKMALAGTRGVDLLLSDCLNAEKQEMSQSESSLAAMFDQEMRTTKGKCFVTIVSSNIHRIQQVLDTAQANGRKVAFVGRSIEQNVKTAVRLGFLKTHGNVIRRKKINDFDAGEICVVIAGSQGQSGSSLSRAALGEHTQVSISEHDKVIFASEPIPGNEYNVYATIDTISRTGAKVTYSDVVDNVHVSGHSSAPEQQLLLSIVTPKEAMPIGGTYHHMVAYRTLAEQIGYSSKQIHLLENGEVLRLSHGQSKVVKTLELKNVMVDGIGIGDVGTVVLRDRARMAGDGMVVILVPIDQQHGRVFGDIEIISRGFVYMKESKGLMSEIQKTVVELLKHSDAVVSDWQALRRKIETAVEKLLYKRTERQPLVLTVLLEV